MERASAIVLATTLAVLIMAPLASFAAVDFSGSKNSVEDGLSKEFAPYIFSTIGPQTGKFPYGRSKGYPQLFTRKTSTLLAEALQMLHRAKDVKERRWLEAYIHRLGGLAADLERSTADGTSPATRNSIVSKVLKQTLKQIKPLSNPEILVRGEPEQIFLAPRSGPKTTVEPDQDAGSENSEKQQSSGRTVAADVEDDLVLQLRRQPLLETSATTREIRSQAETTVVTKMVPHTEPLQTLSVTETPSLTSPVSPDAAESKHIDEKIKKLHDMVGELVEKMREMGIPEDNLMNLLKNEIESKVEEEHPIKDVKRDDDEDFSEEGAAIGDIESSEQQLSNDQAGTVTPARVVDRVEEIPLPKIAREADVGPSTPGMASVQEPAKSPQSDDKPEKQEDDLVKQLQEEKFLIVPTDTSPNYVSEELDLSKLRADEQVDHSQSEAQAHKDEVNDTSSPSQNGERSQLTGNEESKERASAKLNIDGEQPVESARLELQTIDKVVKRLKESLTKHPSEANNSQK